MRTLLLRHHAPVGLQIANAESALLPPEAISVDFAAPGTRARGPITDIGVNPCVADGSMLQSSAISGTAAEAKSP